MINFANHTETLIVLISHRKYFFPLLKSSDNFRLINFNFQASKENFLFKIKNMHSYPNINFWQISNLIM